MTNGYKTVTKSGEKLLKNYRIRISGYNPVIYIDFSFLVCYNMFRNTSDITTYQES